MKKNLIATAVAAIALFSFPAVAQTTAAPACCKAKTECKAECKDAKECKTSDCKKEGCKADCKKADCKKGDCKNCKNGAPCPMAANGKKMEKGMRPNPFEGITLTDDQKAKIEALNAKNAETRKLKAEAMKDKKEAKGDFREAREKEHQEYMKAIEGILTPEQYAKFKENTSRFGRDNGPAHGNRGGKAGFQGKGGNKAHKASGRDDRAGKAEKK